MIIMSVERGNRMEEEGGEERRGGD